MPLFSLRRFVRQQFITDAQAQVLSEIRPYNPLLFDFVLKRSLVSGGHRFMPVVFESRRVFEVDYLSRKTCEPYCLRMEGIL